MKPIRLTNDGRYALLRQREVDRKNAERLLFQRYPEQEWGTFFRFGYRRTTAGIALTWVDALKPEAGDLDRSSPLVEFRPRYIQRALAALDATDLGVGVIHSHPERCAPLASLSDDDMDSYFADEFEKFANGRPYVSLIVARQPDRRVIFTGRVFDRGIWMPLTEWFTVGDALRREQAWRSSIIAGITADDFRFGEIQARAASLFGERATGRIRGARVGIIGCSGTGTPAAHILARAQVGELVLVDPGRFKSSNHERNHASRFTDLDIKPPPLKVDLLARLTREINPQIHVTALAGDILDDAVLDELLRCDLLLGCTDSHYARAALGDVATHYMIPVLDLAVQMRAENGVLREQVGELTRYAPGLPCPWCRGRVEPNAIRVETMTEAERQFWKSAAAEANHRGEDGAQYWGGLPPPEMTVGYLTTMVGAMGAGYAQAWLAGFTRMPHDRFQFDLGLSSLGVASDDRPVRSECSCNRTVGWSDQARADRSVSKPAHWPDAIRLAQAA